MTVVLIEVPHAMGFEEVGPLSGQPLLLVFLSLNGPVLQKKVPHRRDVLFRSEGHHVLQRRDATRRRRGIWVGLEAQQALQLVNALTDGAKGVEEFLGGLGGCEVLFPRPRWLLCSDDGPADENDSEGSEGPSGAGEQDVGIGPPGNGGACAGSGSATRPHQSGVGKDPAPVDRNAAGSDGDGGLPPSSPGNSTAEVRPRCGGAAITWRGANSGTPLRHWKRKVNRRGARAGGPCAPAAPGRERPVAVPAYPRGTECAAHAPAGMRSAIEHEPLNADLYRQRASVHVALGKQSEADLDMRAAERVAGGTVPTEPP